MTEMNQLSFEEAFAELEEIVQRLETGDMSLEERQAVIAINPIPATINNKANQPVFEDWCFTYVLPFLFVEVIGYEKP